MNDCPIPLVQAFIPRGRKNRPERPMKPEWITVHDTANPAKGADAESHANYLKGSVAAEAPVSWHFTVDDKGAYQHLPLTEGGYRAGDGQGPGNTKSIGVEVCENADGDRDKGEENAAVLIAWLLITLGLDAGKVVPHKHWTKATDCPHILWPKWDKFHRSIRLAKYGMAKEPWDPEMEIALLEKMGLINSVHLPEASVTWGEFATVLNRLVSLLEGKSPSQNKEKVVEGRRRWFFHRWPS